MTSPHVPSTVVRLGAPGEIIAAVPYLLGFRPTESLVAIGLRGRKSRLGLTLRIDLPEHDRALETIAYAAAQIKASRADSVIAVIITEADPPQPDDLPARDIAELWRSAVLTCGLEVREILCHRDNRWWSYLCSEPECCPISGTPVDTDPATPFAVAAVADGRAVLPTRDDLVATVSPSPDADSVEVEKLCTAAGVAHLRRLRSDSAQRVVHTEVAFVESVIKQYRDRVPTPRKALARIAVALSDLRIRDVCMQWCQGPDVDAADSLWLALVRWAPVPLAAAPASLLAVSAYIRGDGAFAGICAERAQADDPEYSFAGLILDSLAAGIPPQDIAESIGDTAAELDTRSGAGRRRAS